MQKEKLEKLKKEEKSKDKGFHFFKYILVLFAGSLFGVIYEDLLMLAKTGQFETHRGVIFGPLNPLYGVGFVLFVWLLSKIPKWYHQLVYGSILLGTVEYLSSFFEELLTGSTSWGYSNLITNIDGRTTVIYAFFWGLCAMLIMQFVYPYFLQLLLKIDRKWLRIVVYTLFALYMVDIVFSHTALILCNLRENGYVSKTFVGRFFEKHFPKEVMRKYFVNKGL